MVNFEQHYINNTLPEELYNKRYDELTQLGWFLIGIDQLIHTMKKKLTNGGEG